MEEIDYEKVLADLEAKKAVIEASISSIKVMLGKAVNIGNSGTPSGIPGDAVVLPTTINFDTFFGMTVLDASKKYLDMIKTAKSTKDILKVLSQGGVKTTYGTLSSVLSRGATAGEIAAPKRGMWGLPKFYNGAVQKRKKSTKDSGQPAEVEKEKE